MQRCRKFSWVKCLEQDNVSRELLSPLVRRPLSWRCRINVRKLHPVRFPRMCWEFEPEEPITLDRKILLASLKSSPRGSSPGPGGCTYEHLQVLLEDSNTFDLLIGALNSLAQATVPQQITNCLDECTIDSPLKERWWSAGNRHWHHVEAHRGADTREAVHERVRGRVLSISVCPVHQGWNRLRGAHAPGSDRPRPHRDCLESRRHRSVRPRASVCNVGPVEQDERCTSTVAFCAIVLRNPVHICVVRQPGRTPHSHTSRRW